MHKNETKTESALNESEPRDAWEQASWDDAGAWEAEDDQFDGSFADEDRRETRGEEWHKREQSCMTSGAVVVVIIPKVPTGKAQTQERAEAKDKGRSETAVDPVKHQENC